MATSSMATPSPGNTNRLGKSRNYQLTLNEVDKYENLKNYLKNLKSLNYLISCHEIAPSTGHEHIHIYCQFLTPIKLSLKKTQGAHIEICRASPQQNKDYILKNGDILDEIGEMRQSGNIRTISDLAKIDKSECPPNYYNIKCKIDEEKKSEETFIKMLEDIKNDTLKGPEIIYITGDTGKGKTYKAYKMAVEKYEPRQIGKITINNNFFDIINENAECFIIEEFRASQIKASEFLQFTDKYCYRANIKGGFITLKPKTLIICSIIPPEKIYSEENNKQFLRRITKIINLGFDEKFDFPEVE